jgi:transposase-like protein
MPALPAPAIDLTDDERAALMELTRASSVRTSLAQRAKIVLLAGEGTSNTEIAELVGVSRPTVILWRKRFQDQGIAGLYDEPRQGRPRHVSHEMIVAATLTPPPENLGLTHWSSRSLARRLGVGNATVARCWREYGIQPLGPDTYQFSTVPEMVGGVADVLGLFLAPHCNAIMIRFSHNDRNGLAPGFKALDPVGGAFTGQADQSASGRDFKWFVEQFTDSNSGEDLHLVMDREANDEHAEVLELFETNPRRHVYFTTALASWSRLVAVWLGIVEGHPSGNDLNLSSTDSLTSIRAILEKWDGHVHQGTEIQAQRLGLPALNRQETSHTSHERPRLCPITGRP